jgi:hypothetical protein
MPASPLGPRLFAGALLLTLLPCLSAQQPVHIGERVPAAAISPLVIESMDVVLERERSGAFRPPDQAAFTGQDGRWWVPAQGAKTPTRSGVIAIGNEWGDPRMAIGFGQQVDLESLWAAGHGTAPARALRVIGHRAGSEVARTAWLPLAPEQQLMTLAMTAVDRIEIEAAPGSAPPMAFFALDDLRFAPAGQPQRARTLDFEDLAWRAVLDGTTYQGLTWPRGDGFRRPIADLDLVPAPRSVPDAPGLVTSTEGGSSTAFLGTTPTVPRAWNDFLTVTQGDPGATLVPPDTMGAAGPDHVVTIVNSNISAFVKSTGSRVLNVSIGAFWGSTGTNGDPRAVYVVHAQRFILLSETFSAGRFYYAVSQTADPTGTWFKFSFDTRQGSDAGRWPDYVTLGVDARGIYSATYMVGSPAAMTIFAIDKAPLLAPTPAVGTITAFRSLPFEGAIQPCMTYGDPGRQYFVSRQSSTSLRLRHLLPPLSAPTLVESGSIAVPSHSSPPNAPALGSTTPISTLDTRPMNAVYRDGSVWIAQGISFNSRAACRFYQLGTAPLSLVQYGTVADPVWHYYYPSLAVDRDGNVGLGCSGSHAGVYCSSFLTGRRASDPAGTMAPPILVVAGQASWLRLDGSGRNRFGDYSHTFVDPVDDRGFWTFQEYIGPVANQWRTRATRFGFESINYGDGLAGTSGVPSLRTAGRPVIGQTLGVEVGNSGGLAIAPGALLLGFQTAAIPSFGGTILVDAQASSGVAVATPFTTVPVAIPNDPGLTGVAIFMQAGQFDPAAVQGIAMSRGLEVVFGSR